MDVELYYYYYTTNNFLQTVVKKMNYYYYIIYNKLNYFARANAVSKVYNNEYARTDALSNGILSKASL